MPPKDPTDVTLESNGDYWRAAWWDNGRRIRKGLGHKSKVSERAARRMCRDIAVRNATNPSSRSMGRTPKLSAWIDQYHELREHEISAGRMANDKAALEPLRDFAGHLRLDRVTPAVADDYRASLRKLQKKSGDGLISETTAHSYMSRARTLFSRAESRGMIASNPFKGRVGTAPPPAPHHVPTDDEVRRIIDAAGSHHWRCLLGLCALAGLRLGEARILTWPAVRFDEGRLIVTQPKTARVNGLTRETRLEPELATILADANVVARGERICDGSFHNVARNIHTIFKKAGVEPWLKPTKALREWRATTWRRHFPENVVDAWLGHSLAVARKHYAKVEDHYYQAETKESDEVARLRKMLIAAGIDPDADNSAPKPVQTTAQHDI